MKYLFLTLLLVTNFESKSQTIMKITKERITETSPFVIWDVLTKPEYIEKWLGVKVESDWKVDSELLFKFSWQGKDFVDKGRIIVFDENEAFVYTYWSNFSGLIDEPENYSKIKFKIGQKGEKTLLELTHSDIKNQIMYEHSDKNWEETLNQIINIAKSIDNK